MRCDDARQAISARLDGELLPDDEAPLDHHLARCQACATWAGELHALHRRLRLRPAEPVPDLSAAIVTQARPAPRPTATWGTSISATRWALLVVALTQLVLAAPALLLGETSGAGVHAARELGSFDVALAVGLLVAAWQPERAWGLLPVVAVLGLVVAGTSVLDVVDGSASSGGEAHHLLDLAGVVLLWLVARERRPLPDVRALAT